MSYAYYKRMAYKCQALDWVVVVAMYVTAAILNTAVYPHCRTFEWDDATINHSSRADTFPTASLFVMIVLAPVFYILFSRFCVDPLRRLVGEPLSLLSRGDDAASDVAVAVVTASTAINNSNANTSDDGNSNSNTAFDTAKIRSLKCGTGPVYQWIKAHFWAVALDQFVIDIMKLYAGRLRPDYIDRLRTEGFTASTPGIPNPKEDPEFYCKLIATHPRLREGRKSFPSGHSGSSFVVFTVMSFFFFAHLRPFARQGSFARLMLSLLPLLVPLFCAVSRTRDNKHHFSDILGGSVIGIASALLIARLTFREAGGPVTVYLARSESDVEYAKQVIIMRGGGGGSGAAAAGGGGAGRRDTGGLVYRRSPAASADYQATGGTEMTTVASATSPTTAAGRPGYSEDENGTVAISIGSGSPGPASSGANNTNAASDGSSGGGGSARRVVTVTTVTERELNEDPEAVPWI